MAIKVQDLATEELNDNMKIPVSDAGVAKAISIKQIKAISSFKYFEDFNTRDINIPPITTDTDVSRTGDGLEVVMLPDNTDVASGILHTIPFFTEYYGGIYIETDTGGELNVDSRFNHSIMGPDGMVSFRSDRSFVFDVRQAIPITVGLNFFNSSSSIPLGMYRTRDGTEVNVTQELLDSDITVSLKFYFTLSNKAGDRLNFKIKKLKFRNPQVLFYQI